MAVRRVHLGIEGPRPLAAGLRVAQSVADEGLSTAACLALALALALTLALGKPLSLEGAPGFGKTEAAKAMAAVPGRDLIRRHCHERNDAAVGMYEWSFPHQMPTIRQAGNVHANLCADDFRIAQPLLPALRVPMTRVLLIDQIDRADHELRRSCSKSSLTSPCRSPNAAPSAPPDALSSS